MVTTPTPVCRIHFRETVAPDDLPCAFAVPVGGGVGRQAGRQADRQAGRWVVVG